MFIYNLALKEHTCLDKLEEFVYKVYIGSLKIEST